MHVECPHKTAPATSRMCKHLISRPGINYCQRFTGVGRRYDLVCPECAGAPHKLDAQLGFVCQACFASAEATGVWEPEPGRAIIGRPKISERPEELTFVHEMIRLPRPLPATILDFQPIARATAPSLIALLDSGKLVRLDLNLRSVESLGAVELDRSAAPGLALSPCGTLAAVYARRGRRGVVLDLEAGRMTMTLDRGELPAEDTEFPITFFEHEGRTLLAHATAANRVDVSDPHTGALCTHRDHASRRLDYVHGQLLPSPSGAWVADSGWVSGPAGFVSAWSIRRWLAENVFESEDGPTKKYFDQRWYFWEGAMCWIGDDALAVWGYGPDEACLLPAVVLYDVDRGRRLSWFPGPEGWLAYDQYLFSCHGEHGTSVWDTQSGERVHYDPGFHPQRYHRGARRFLTTRQDGEFFVVSALTRATPERRTG